MANRNVEKCTVLRLNVVYQLCELYTTKTVNGDSIVGGCRVKGSDDLLRYVWMPSALVKNMTSQNVVQMNSQLSYGKTAFFVYEGVQNRPAGGIKYLIRWVKNGVL